MRRSLMVATAGLLALAAAPASAQDCQSRINALNATLDKEYPGLSTTAGEPEAGSDQASTDGALSGNPPLTTETSTAEEVPTSVMPGAGPEIELEEETAAIDPSVEEKEPSQAAEAKAGRSTRQLSQEEIDRIVALRTEAMEHQSAGAEQDCVNAVAEARTIISGRN